MRVDEDGVDGVGPGAVPEGLAQADRPVVEAEERGEGGGARHAALVERRQDGHLVVVGAPEAPAVVQVQRVRLVAERLEYVGKFVGTKLTCRSFLPTYEAELCLGLEK